MVYFKMSGYVYCMRSEAFPGLFKIGKTENLGQCLEKANTNMPTNLFVYCGFFESDDFVGEERLAHAHFVEDHFNKDFYTLSPDQMSKYFTERHIEYHLRKAPAAPMINDIHIVCRYMSALANKGEECEMRTYDMFTQFKEYAHSVGYFVYKINALSFGVMLSTYIGRSGLPRKGNVRRIIPEEIKENLIRFNQYDANATL